MFYCFESFPIEKLTRLSLQGKLLEPKEKFVWREILDDSSDACTPHCFGTSFVQVGDLIYAAGGFKTDEEDPEYSFIAPRNLPREFCCISLSTPLENSRAEYKYPMHGGKYNPLIEKIDGLIYVLSAPRPRYGADIVDNWFEVYHPLEDRWVRLRAPPFLEKKRYSAMFFYSYVVIGAKLCVSSGEYSCVYDTKLKRWEACELFSDFMPQEVKGSSGTPSWLWSSISISE